MILAKMGEVKIDSMRQEMGLANAESLAVDSAMS